MRGRREPKSKPRVIIFEEKPEIRHLYNETLRDECELTFLTNWEETLDFMKFFSLMKQSINCMVFDSHFSNSRKRLSTCVKLAKQFAYTGPIIAASSERNDELMDKGATDRPEGDLKQNVPALVLQTLGLS
jgi:hypothetical protein